EKSSALVQKICWEEPEKQKTRSCRAQELSRSCAQWRGRERKQCTETSSISANEDRSHRTKGRQAARTSCHWPTRCQQKRIEDGRPGMRYDFSSGLVRAARWLRKGVKSS